MLTYEDCIALCELDEDEIKAIAEHEHIPRLAAAEMGSYLVHSHDGVVGISKMIRDDIEHARRHGDITHAAKLKLVLKHFVDHHPRDFGKATG